MDRLVTPPKRVTSPTWGPPSPCKQALRNTIREKNVRKFHVTRLARMEAACVLRKGFMSFMYNIS